MRQKIKMSQTTVNKIAVITKESYETIISDAVTALQNGELIVVPTETRYGLLANASDDAALEKLYQAKQRPGFMPTAIFVKSYDEIFVYGELTRSAEKLAKAYLPGPLTLILTAKIPMKKYVVFRGKIGIRYSGSKFIADLLSRIDFPLSATSANISGKNECESIEEITKEFSDSVSLYVDGGNLTNAPSTVVDVSSKELSFHRVGAISKEHIILKVES